MGSDFRELDRQIARARIAVSLAAIVSIYVDPSAGGLFRIPALLLATLGSHFAYSLAANFSVTRHQEGCFTRNLSTGLDLAFATAVAFLTEGGTSPAFVFFVFAILASVFRNGARDALPVTLYSVSLYVLVIVLSHGFFSVFMMRAVYLAIAGYLIGFFGRERARFEAQLREFQAEKERLTIARSLHDGYIQALAGINLRVEACRDLLANDLPSEALAETEEIRRGVEREYDQVQRYIRFLARGSKSVGAGLTLSCDPQTCISADLSVRASIAEHVLEILVEGLRNIRRHSFARTSNITINQQHDLIRIRIDDDGVGFGHDKLLPWTIASRIAEINGRLTLRTDVRTGAHLEMEIPSS